MLKMDASLQHVDIYTAFVRTAQGPLKHHLKLVLAVLFTFGLQVSLLVYVGLGFKPRNAQRINSDNNGGVLQTDSVWMLLALCKVAGLSALALFTQAEAQTAVGLFEEVLERIHPTLQNRQSGDENTRMSKSAATACAGPGTACGRGAAVDSENLVEPDVKGALEDLKDKSCVDSTRNHSSSSPLNRSGWLLLPCLMHMTVVAAVMFLQGLVFQTYYPPVTWYYQDNGTIHGIILSCLALSYIMQLDNQAWGLMQAVSKNKDVRSVVSFSGSSNVALLPLGWLRRLFKCCKHGDRNAASSVTGKVCNAYEPNTAANECSHVPRARQLVCRMLRNLAVFLFHLAVLVYTTLYATFIVHYATEHNHSYSLWRSPLAAPTVLLALSCFMGFQTLAGLRIKPPRFFTSKPCDEPVQQNCSLPVSGQSASSKSSAEMSAGRTDTGASSSAEQYCDFCAAYCWIANIALPIALALATKFFNNSVLARQDTCISQYEAMSNVEERSILIMQCTLSNKAQICPRVYWTDSKSYYDLLIAFHDCIYFWVTGVPLAIIVGACSICIVLFGCLKHKCLPCE